MKNTFLLLTILFIGSCSDAAETSSNQHASMCEFQLSKLSVCKLGELSIKLNTKKISEDEVAITSMIVTSKHNEYDLMLSDEVSLIDGDIGYITNEDINFDGYADIAITTSFGTPNLYLDYWVYDKVKEGFVYVGHYSKFDIDADKKTLQSDEKINAAHYKKSSYRWQGSALIKE